MKVVHVLKKIEMIDQDIKELRKLEKSIQRDKSFSTPIYMSIEKQINIMLGERIKLLDLKIENPPQNMVEEIEGKKSEDEPFQMKSRQQEKRPAPARKKSAARPSRPSRKHAADSDLDMDEMPMLTQAQIDARFESIRSEKQSDSTGDGDESVKLLDIALEKGSLEKKDIEKEKEKKVRFFRDNFPVE